MREDRGGSIMSEADLKTNSKIRKILVENNYDLSCLSVSTSSGSVSVHGELQKLGGRKLAEHEIGKTLAVLESVILRTKGVKRVNFHIQNWRKKKGKWAKGDD
jgi:hypothetical protein